VAGAARVDVAKPIVEVALGVANPPVACAAVEISKNETSPSRI
jgi:hypothetical protein